MRILHDVAIVPRAKLKKALAIAGLHEQLERITVTPRQLSIEEISKLWSVFQTQYQVSAAYLVTVVLIDSKASRRTPLPVLKRGPDDRGVTAVAMPPPSSTRSSRRPVLARCGSARTCWCQATGSTGVGSPRASATGS